MFNEYEIVRLKRPVGELAAGMLGTIVMVYPGEPPGYEVEFCDDKGFTLALLTLHEEDLIAAPVADRGDRR